MRSKDRKKQQLVVNKIVKHLNQNIYNDDLWLGRFFIHQYDAHYMPYKDRHGGCLILDFKLVDKKTGQIKNICLPYNNDKSIFSYYIWEEMNTFIIEDCKVWNESDITNNRIDFRGSKYA